MSKLTLMSGIPGSGKSTWLKDHINPSDVIVSRDAIRFSLLGPDDDYFAKENQVFKMYIAQINQALNEGHDVYADATHLNRASRNKLLSNISSKELDEIGVIFMNTSLETALERNDLREGLAFVSKGQIKRMFYSIQEPDLEEGFNFIVKVNEDGSLKGKMAP